MPSEPLFFKLGNVITDKRANLKEERDNKICVLYYLEKEVFIKL